MAEMEFPRGYFSFPRWGRLRGEPIFLDMQMGEPRCLIGLDSFGTVSIVLIYRSLLRAVTFDIDVCAELS